ncbi:TPA: glycosyltransferase [Burkholderia multivorans]|nr:glycosyltransferase [Burkholderia multivorans]HDR9295504.1 glycosyltransferase [Burkholderia multivorans]HDR9301472.1 glycosyltransferase [Burkholderia multivorans]HDR9307050.1 glycosyltransferase [Burkholderia multivorans]HDR9312882.1 glycosyltransferase [Burkholderia multivorans]
MNALAVKNFSDRAITWVRIRRWAFLLRDCPLFVSQWYREQYPDVAQAGIDGLTHYLTRGWREGRNPGPGFDGAYYLARYSDVAASGLPPLLHYWVVGRHEMRRPNPSLDLEWIAATAERDSDGQRAVPKIARSPSAQADGDRLAISVIIPTYNRERMLPGVLDAWREVDRKTEVSYEIIFSDDGSEDGTVALLESVADLPIRVLRNQHGGASSARNAAIRAAKGQRLLIIGDDIFPHPDLINVHWALGIEKGPLVATLGVVDWHPELKVNHLMTHITEIGNEQFSYNRLKDGEYVDFRHFYTCNICVDRDVLASQETLFDHRFDQYGFEDIELGYRLARQGMRIFYTRDAKGDHFHPYNIAGFCRRQMAAGRMAVVFRSMHTEVGAIIGVDALQRVLKNGLPAPNVEAMWKSRLDRLVARAENYECLFNIANRAGRLIIGNCLSTIYVPLFRAMYEYGVLQRLAGTEAVLSIAMSRHFGAAWDPYWQLLDADTPDFKGATRATLDQVVETTLLDAEVGDTLASQICREVSILATTQGATDGASAMRARWRRRISTGVHYLRHNPRQLVPLMQNVLRRRRERASAHIQTTREVEHVSLSSAIALVVEPGDVGSEPLVTHFRSAFGEGARVFERVDIGTLRELSTGTLFAVDTVPCGVLYWPEEGGSVCDSDTLIDAWLAVVENGVDLAVISYGYDEPAMVRAGSRRNHLLFSRRIAPSVFEGALARSSFTGKVIRAEARANLPSPSAQPLSEWIGTPVTTAPTGFFVTEESPRGVIRYLAPQFPPRSAARPVVFVFPIFVAVGGVERNTVEIIRELNSRYDFVVVTMERLRAEQGSLGRQFQDAGARLVQMSEFTDHSNYLCVLGHMKAWLKPSLVWICNGSPWLADNAQRLRLMFADLPIVDQQVYDVEQGWINRYHEPGIRSFDRFIAVNQKIHSRFVGELGRSPSQVDLIYSAVNTSRILDYKSGVHPRAKVLQKYNLPSDKRLFAFIGRLTAQKRPIEFLRLAEARALNNDELFVLVGDGELAPSVDAFIREHRLTNVVRIPYVANTLELDSVLDGLVFTSAYEGLPIAMLEALLLAVPTFATDVGDIGVVLEEFEGGLVYPVNASKTEMLDAFDRWLAKRDQYRSALIANESALLERFSSGRIARQYVECFDKAMASYRDGVRKLEGEGAR